MRGTHPEAAIHASWAVVAGGLVARGSDGGDEEGKKEHVAKLVEHGCYRKWCVHVWIACEVVEGKEGSLENLVR